MPSILTFPMYWVYAVKTPEKKNVQVKMCSWLVPSNFKIHVARDFGAWIWHIVSDHPGAEAVVASSSCAFPSEVEARLDCQQKLASLRSDA
ncbi:hypothetical protein [Caballeronia sordidicola]|uniref:hypothetical protein n=1 Tax=Caballeronia sordidicola TaxID=196367 RepID=UPI001177E344|nr:hypothetical protein [Caballeronia sordidicola]